MKEESRNLSTMRRPTIVTSTIIIAAICRSPLLQTVLGKGLPQLPQHAVQQCGAETSLCRRQCSYARDGGVVGGGVGLCSWSCSPLHALGCVAACVRSQPFCAVVLWQLLHRASCMPPASLSHLAAHGSLSCAAAELASALVAVQVVLVVKGGLAASMAPYWQSRVSLEHG